MRIKNKKMNQEGLTSIMIAMFITVVVSLLAIGYATVARRDQTATLDKNLSYQAQYAAESGVNKVIEYINSNPSADGEGNCDDNVSEFDKSFDVGSANVTCATWSSNVDKIVMEPSSSTANFASFTGVRDIKISWNSSVYSGFTTNNPLPNPMDSANKPIIAVNIAESTFVLPASAVNFRYYLVPTDNSGCANQNFGLPSGTILCAKISGSVASVNIKNLDPNKEYFINSNAINTTGSVRVTIEKGSESGTFINTSQYIIDVNAKAQDVYKRLIVYYSKSGIPASPYVMNIQPGGKICKDIKVDGTQNLSVSGGAVCPST